MDWDEFPITGYYNLRGAIDRLQKGLAERYLSLADDAHGISNWPNGAFAWEYFIIDAVDGTGETVTADVDENGDPISWEASRWYDYSDEEAEWVPQFYDLCIYTGTEDECDRDPKKAVRVEIIGSGTNTLTLPAGELVDRVTGNVFPSLASLAGKSAWILPRDTNDQLRPWWHQRRITGFNDGAYVRGTATAATATSATISQGTGARRIAEDELAGKHIVGFDSAGRLRRVTISGNDASSGGAIVVQFASQPETFTGDVAVFNSSTARHWPADEDFPGLALWYSGAMDDFAVHAAAGSTTIGTVAADEVDVQLEQVGETCLGDTIASFDLPDAHVSFDDICDDRDKWYNRQLSSTIRGLQIYAEGLGSVFTEQLETYQGETSIEAMNAVGQFGVAGINTTSTTATAASSEVEFTISIPDEAEHWWYRVLDHRGWTIAVGANQTKPSGSTITFATNSSLDGKTLTLQYSLGWDREISRRAKYAKGSTIWVPDLDGGVPVDPPTADFPGTFEHQDKSSSWAEYDDHGRLNDGFGAFEIGDKAILTGDNIQTVTLGHDFAISTDGSTALAPYYNHGAATDHPAAVQAAIDETKSVLVAEGGDKWIRDDTKNWWDPIWHDDQPSMPTNSSSATSGSSASLTDTAKIDDPYWQAMENSGRVFIVRFITGPNAGRRVPTASIDASTGTVTFASGYGLSAVGSGDQYSIPWPTSYEPNLWQDVPLLIDDGAGNTYETIIRYSDDQYLFFDSIGVTPQPDWTARIMPARVGRVVRWDGDLLREVTTGDPRAVEPDKLARYGRARRGDVMSASVLNQIWELIDMCESIVITPGYRSREDPDVEEFNTKEGNGIQVFDPHDPASCAAIRAVADADFDAASPFEETDTPPLITAGTTLGGDICAAGKKIRYLYAVHDRYSCRPFSMVVYVYATINGNDPDDGSGTVGSCTFGTNGNKYNFIAFDDTVHRVYNSMGGASGPGEMIVPIGDTSLSEPDYGACPPAVVDCDDDPPDNVQYNSETASNGWYAFDTKAVIHFTYENKKAES